MVEIVFLYEFPEATKFCSDYIESLWEYEPEKAKNTVNACFNDKGLPFILVAKEGMSIIGVVMTSSESDDATKKYSPWLQMLYVKEQFRNKGIGTELIKTACDNLKKMGYSKVYIDTVNASGFYKKLGWKFVEDAKWKNETTSIFVTDL